MKSKIGKFLTKLGDSIFFSIFLGATSTVLLVLLIYDVNILEKTISMAGSTKRVLFFFWSLTSSLFFVVGIDRLSRKNNASNVWIKVCLAVAFFSFIMMGIHDWNQVGQTAKGLLLHTVPACIFSGLCYFTIMHVLWKIRKNHTLADLFFWAMVVLFPGFIVYMSLCQTCALPELLPLLFVGSIIFFFNFLEGKINAKILEKKKKKDLLYEEKENEN